MENTLRESVKNVMLVGVGAAAFTAEKTSELIDEMIVKGKATVKKGKVANEELKRTLKERQEARERAEIPSLDEVLARIDTMNAEEKQAVREKLDQDNA